MLADAIEIVGALTRDPDDGPHVVTGPIHVEGALPGDLLAITVLETTPRVPYGVISNRHGRGALPGRAAARAETTSACSRRSRQRDGGPVGCLPAVEGGERLVEFPLAPFLGIMGVAVAGDERPHSVPPGAHGGNIDINLLQVGSTLYLPVQVPGALAYVGRPALRAGRRRGRAHRARGVPAGDAAVRRRARPPQAVARFGVARRDRSSRRPSTWCPTGLDADLDEAVRRCVRAALALLQARWGLDEHLAYAYLSAATDIDISQVVDQVCGVHARIRIADFDGLAR